MRSRHRVAGVVAVVAVVVVLAVGLAIWRLTGGPNDPVTVGACRVPAGPVAVVTAGGPEPPELHRIIAYEADRADRAGSFTVVQVRGDAPTTVDTMNLVLRQPKAMRRWNMTRMLEGEPAPVTGAGLRKGLEAAVAETRKAGTPATIVVLTTGTAAPLPDLRGVTVIGAGAWSAAARTAGAACVAG